jgi:8-oxo-dGTP diphosphatase
MPGPYCYEYPRPQVTVDLVVFALIEKELRMLLVRRGKDPFAGRWAIPGGFMEMDEPAETAARRELREETGLEIVGAVEPIGFFEKPGRDPRGRTITLAYAAVIRAGRHEIKGADDAAEAAWVDVNGPLDLAFDHDEILTTAKRWLKRGIQNRDLGTALLPKSFRSRDLNRLFGALNLSRGQARTWVGRMRRLKLIELEKGPTAQFRQTGVKI